MPFNVPFCLLLALVASAPSSSSGISHGHPPSEFINSFLSRASLLDNASRDGEHAPAVADLDSITVSLHVENWSPYDLGYTAHAVPLGRLDTAWPPRDLAAKRRYFAVRTLATDATEMRATAGMVGWTVRDNGAKISRLAVAWEVRERGDQVRYAVSLGDFVPQYDQMWLGRKNGRLVSEVKSGLDDLLLLADVRTTVAARMEEEDQGRGGMRRGRHYKLTLTIVPQNVDVWGWEKYFKAPPSPASSSNGNKRPAANDAARQDDANIEERQNPLPKITRREEAGRSDSRSYNSNRRETTTTTTSSAATSSSYFSSPPASSSYEAASRQQRDRPIYERKDLLAPGPVLTRLRRARGANFTLRQGLREDGADRSAAVGLEVENWTRFRLGRPRVEVDSGEVVGGYEPGGVGPGHTDVGMVGSKGIWRGTSGVARWTIGSTKRILSVMWSVPYNRQFFKMWLSVGLSSRQDEPSYDFLYSARDDSRFVRQRSGHEFEFADPSRQFLVVARMDGGATFKPVLHVGLVPLRDDDLASRVRYKLGLPIVNRDDEEELEGVEEPPRSGLTQAAGAGPASSGPAGHALVVGVAVAAVWLRR